MTGAPPSVPAPRSGTTRLARLLAAVPAGRATLAATVVVLAALPVEAMAPEGLGPQASRSQDRAQQQRTDTGPSSRSERPRPATREQERRARIFEAG